MKNNKKLITDNSKSLLKAICLKYCCGSSFGLYEKMKLHPDFPSFSSLQYILHLMKKDSFAIEAKFEDLKNMPKPFIIHATTNVDLFLLVNNVTESDVEIIDEHGELKKIEVSFFKRIWDGYVFIIDDSPCFFKISFADKINIGFDKIRTKFVTLALISLFIYILFTKQNDHTLLFYMYLLGLLTGLIASIFLFIQQIDKNNIYVKKICSNTSNKIDCSTILDFKGAKFLDIIYWSDLGMIYFLSLLLILLFTPFIVSQIIINVSSIFTLFYVLYSLYYQKNIAHKWCTLCLIVQFVFLYFFFLSINTINIPIIFNIRSIYWTEIFILIVCTISFYSYVKQWIITDKEKSILQKKINEIVFNDEVKNYLIRNELPLPEIKGIDKVVIGSFTAENSLTLIFNPKCGICIKELQKIIPIILRKKGINLNLIFLIENNEKDSDSKYLTRYLLRNYIDNPLDFYNVLQNYVNHYPGGLNEIIKEEKLINDNSIIDQFINIHSNWCEQNKLYYTPIVFINKNKFPDAYNIIDIDYLYF